MPFVMLTLSLAPRKGMPIFIHDIVPSASRYIYFLDCPQDILWAYPAHYYADNYITDTYPRNVIFQFDKHSIRVYDR